MDEILQWAMFYGDISTYMSLIGTTDENDSEYPTLEALESAAKIVARAILQDVTPPVPRALLAIGEGAIAFVTFTDGGVRDIVIAPDGTIDPSPYRVGREAQRKNALCN